jgi:hypothetical protein
LLCGWNNCRARRTHQGLDHLDVNCCCWTIASCHRACAPGNPRALNRYRARGRKHAVITLRNHADVEPPANHRRTVPMGMDGIDERN